MTKPSSQLIPFLPPPPPHAFKRGVKLEPRLKASSKPLRFPTPLYIEPLEVGDGGPITQKEFAKRFVLHAIGMNLKHDSMRFISKGNG
jgi:hypothetical protein